MDLFTNMLAEFSSATTITAVIAFVTGVISVYSSSSFVVMPAFLSAIPKLIEKIGGGDPLAIAYSINVGASRRCFTALDFGRAVHCECRRERESQCAVSLDAHLGIVHVPRWRYRLFHFLWAGLKGSLP